GVPFHGFLQAIGWSAHRTPTIDEYRWLAHSHFVFGAKQLSYFYYQAPYVDGGPEGFVTALVDYDGNKTELYDNAKTVNAELAAMSPAFMAFDHRTFMTAGFDEFELEQMGIGDAVPVFGGASLSGEDKIVAGCFEKGDLNGFYVMNYSFEESAGGVLDLGRERRYEIWDGTGLAKSGSADQLEIELKAGQAVFVVVE
ncbi:MAG: hypothetical protein GX815_14895, partial [Clostridiales bacterium]|nr:hypothetical protein [Clostridiales bacterium]